MGIVFEINSLEEMCDLMCGNRPPRQSRKGKTRNGNSERDARSPASVHSGVRGSIQSSPVECDRGVLAGCNCEEHDECEEIEHV